MAPAGVWGVGTSQTPVRVILHDTESHDAAGEQDISGILSGWRNAEARLGFLPGAHFIVDADGNLGKVADVHRILNHAGGLNTDSVGIEQVGFASFTEADWLERRDQLEVVARLLAWLHVEYGIPLEIPAKQGPGLPMHGVMTHAMVSRFEPASDGHSDPGSGYPIAHVLKLAKSYVAAGGWPALGTSLGPKFAILRDGVVVAKTNSYRLWLSRHRPFANDAHTITIRRRHA